MTDQTTQTQPDGRSFERAVRPWEKCAEHGPAKPNVWACPDCLIELRRWKSTHAPRLDALEALLSAAQIEAAQGREARATLESERAANALLTDEVERLRAAIGQAIFCLRTLLPDDKDAQMTLRMLNKALTPNTTAEQPAERTPR